MYGLKLVLPNKQTTIFLNWKSLFSSTKYVKLVECTQKGIVRFKYMKIRKTLFETLKNVFIYIIIPLYPTPSYNTIFNIL